MIKVIAHRGDWSLPNERNTELAFRRAFSLGIGVETDIRDCQGKLVISHDPPTDGEGLMEVREFLALHKEYNQPGFLALNIKADGLHEDLKWILNEFEVANYAVFDMSIPDLVCARKFGLHFLSRVSNLETDPIFIEDASGVWCDDFEGNWINSGLIQSLSSTGKPVFVVSPELHGRAYNALWDDLRSVDTGTIYVCTDHCSAALEFFGA